ncbi:MAG: hypothetical protein M0Z63_01200, partial [Actinomycetota bacterium]|nr:hypothetical protein [Actinomycetota bacterium]
MNRATVVLDRTAQALAVDRDRAQRRGRRIVVVGVLFGRGLLGRIGRNLDPRPPGVELADDDLVDDRVELVTLDRPQHALDGGERGSDQASAPWRTPGVEATEQLFIEVLRPLGDLGRVVAAREHRCRAHEEDRGELVADAPGLSVVGDL